MCLDNIPLLFRVLDLLPTQISPSATIYNSFVSLQEISLAIVVTDLEVAFPSQTQSSLSLFYLQHSYLRLILCPLAIPSICEYREKQWSQLWLISIHDTPVIKSEGESPIVK